MITKVQVHRKKGYTESLIRTQQRAVKRLVDINWLKKAI